MKQDISRILKEAMKLPPEARAALAGTWLDCHKEIMDPEVEAAWKAEIILRLKEINQEKMAISNNNKAPIPRDRELLKNLFIQRDRISTLDAISKGLHCVVKNAESLLDEAKILADANKKARASFLVVTANEEIAKAYILLDACRLDFSSQQSILKLLCKAFYDHIPKYAYYKTIWYSTNAPIPWPRIGEFFKNELVKWWPSNTEDEPDMPHNIYFDRESNLYVDFSDYAQTWVIPIPENPRQEFGNPLCIDIYSKSCKSLNRLISANQEGLFKVEVLDIINEVFRKDYINSKTDGARIDQLYLKIIEKLRETFGISEEKFKNSALMTWPLYHFLSEKP